VRCPRSRLAAHPPRRRGRHGHRRVSRALFRLPQDRHHGLPCRRIPDRSPATPSRFAVPTHSDLRPVFLAHARHAWPGSSATALREGGPVSPTWFASLPRGWTPMRWKRDHQPDRSVRVGLPEEPGPELSVSVKHSRAAWARLIKTVYDADLQGGSRRQPARASKAAAGASLRQPADLLPLSLPHEDRCPSRQRRVSAARGP
jgi:hypothetical protein